MRAWGLLLALAATIIVATGLPLRVRLDRPRLGTPQVQEPGTKLEVYLRTSLPWAAPAARLSLEDDAGADFPLAAPTRWWRGNILCLTTRIPDLKDGRYALRVRTSSQRPYSCAGNGRRPSSSSRPGTSRRRARRTSCPSSSRR